MRVDVCVCEAVLIVDADRVCHMLGLLDENNHPQPQIFQIYVCKRDVLIVLCIEHDILGCCHICLHPPRQTSAICPCY